MQTSVSTRRLTAWLASLAILMAALAPSLSQALAASRAADSFWAQICSVNKDRSAQSGDERERHSSGLKHEQCPFCTTHAGSYGLPPHANTLLHVGAVFASYLPFLFSQSPHVLYVWATPQSRAPPGLS